MEYLPGGGADPIEYNGNLNAGMPGGSSTTGLFTMPNGQIAQSMNTASWLGTCVGHPC